MKTSSPARRAFTLTEILVVIGVIALLAAILFPVMSRARQSSYRARCANNLQQIYISVRQYKQEENAYPYSIAAMLPASSRLVITSGPSVNVTNPGGSGGVSTNGISGNSTGIEGGGSGGLTTTTVSTGGTGILKQTDILRCQSDTVDTVAFASSYEVKNVAVWNFLGYDPQGYTLTRDNLDLLNAAIRSNPTRPYHEVTNPVVNSLSNRFAPSSTIITHCIYHRGATSGLGRPEELYNNGSKGAGARDIVLRLDGTTKTVDVSQWNIVQNGASRWQKTEG